nr:reverse transcriptase [Tanacetum cinerariifolium]
DGDRIKMVSIHLFDQALTWHLQFIKTYKEAIAWDVYEAVILQRFWAINEDPMAELKNLNMFICGLPASIELKVRMFKPRSFTDAFSLVGLQEATIEAPKQRNAPILTTPKTASGWNSNRSVTYPSKSTTTPLALPALNNQTVTKYPADSMSTLRKMLSQQEFVEKRLRISVSIVIRRGCETVLGVQWLSTLGTIQWNFKDLVMKFQYEGQKLNPHRSAPCSPLLRGTHKSELAWLSGRKMPKKFTPVFFDDILVYSPSIHEHIEHLRMVLQVMREQHLFAKQSKCVFGTTQVEYLGHVISAKGVSTDPRKSSLLVVVNRLLKFAHFLPLAHPYTASQVAQLFLDNVYKLHGLPKTIVTDRDKVFMSLFWQSLFKKLLGQVVPLAEYWYNTNYHSVLDTTPYEVVSGQTPHMHIPYVAKDSPVEAVDRTLLAREQVVQLLKFNLRKHKIERSLMLTKGGTSEVSENYKNADYPDLLHLPFPDETDVLKHLFYGESGSGAFEANLTSFSSTPINSC